MIIQIYTVQTPEEGVALAQAGVNHIGITPSAIGLPGEVSNQTAKRIFERIGNQAVKVALSVDSDLSKIVAMVQIVKPNILHLCGDVKLMTPEKVAELRKLLPPIKIMQAVPVVNQKAIEIAKEYQEVVDFLILDSVSEDIGGIGAAGFTHDWKVSREIVCQSRLPVILAGGLSPENVAEAIRVVRPWGVDSLTHTNQPLGEGKFRKSLERVRLFIEAAHAADQKLASQST
ncbi:MAG: phosphoribosylanthranilate isomerase [Chloroflexi bacterium]|nr:MAG: phosphoribosylanthranilate isomerase [Chloroflexota bacterium]MBA4376114.1 N-(5'-phosphoribosyl)anthranilate isomerase [Anaerolinea sp.]